jgi:hypothetical protein
MILSSRVESKWISAVMNVFLKKIRIRTSIHE